MDGLAAGRLSRLLSNLSNRPGYTLMRVFARFSWARYVVLQVRRLVVGVLLAPFRKYQEGAVAQSSVFGDIDVDRVVSDISEQGVAFGLRLPKETVDAIRKYAASSECYADRDPRAGFNITEREVAQGKLGKKILVAQYFNTTSECPEISRLARDPVLNKIACQFLKSTPRFVGANLWWTFPVDATREDRDRHAHFFHRDVDDFRFFKFFFYLTDVEKGDGAHICVLRSQGNPPVKHTLDRWNIRRYTDEEIEEHYSPEQVLEICGKAGEGFAENTWCIHKGQTPTNEPRLLLQLQFALFDYGAMHDRRDGSVLQNLV